MGISESNYIQFEYWGSLQKGLLSGVRLVVHLEHLDAAYLEGTGRKYELTKNVSLRQLNPVALLQFKQGGERFFEIAEAIFDLDCPKHYIRQVKSISITIHYIMGPYTSVVVKLTLIKSTIRTTSLLYTGKKQYERSESDLRFQDLYSHMQAIVTSRALNDRVTFEGPNHRGER